jgi:5-methylcytosine-specific restriction enzyme subunit McrC
MIKKQITVFEHGTLLLNEEYKGVQFSKEYLDSLLGYYGNGKYKPNLFINLDGKQKYLEEKSSFPFYNLIHNGIQFNQFVGVLQVKDLIIEVLPKIDKKWNNELDEAGNWRSILIKMLKAVSAFDISVTSFSALKLSPNHFLDVYFELFVIEIEKLLQLGLIKKYRTIQENKKALIGSLLFSAHIQQNLVHKERFYVQTTEYDTQHLIHSILLQALNVLFYSNKNKALKSRINKLILDFPEQNKVNIQQSTFDKLILNRKSDVYKNALLIAKMILLNLHPDLSKGKNDVIALMFDMNVLWEKFIYKTLKAATQFEEVEEQKIADFWEIKKIRMAYFKADIFIKHKGTNYVIDTKWKIVDDNKPSNDDLRQMFAYLHYYKSPKTALLYPGKENDNSDGTFYERTHDVKKEECSLLKVEMNEDMKKWQENICSQIKAWIGILDCK